MSDITQKLLDQATGIVRTLADALESTNGDAIDTQDIDNKVSDAIDAYDFDEKVLEGIDNYNLDDKIREFFTDLLEQGEDN